jgi:hypothetical protein
VAKNTSRQKNSCNQWGKGSMHPGGPGFFLLVEGGSVGFLLLPWSSHCVPIKFSMCSQHVPSGFSLYPISFDLSLSLVTNITRFKEGFTPNIPICFWIVHSVICYLWNLFHDGPLKDPITKTFQLNFGSSQLITMLTGSDFFGKFSKFVYLN